MERVQREHRDKADLLQTMRAERAKLDALFDSIPDERMTLPGAMGEWTCRDMLSHLMGYENWAAAQVDPALRASLKGVFTDRMDDTEERNRFYHELYKDWPVADVRKEARRVFEELLAAVEAAGEETLDGPVAFDAQNNLSPTNWDATPDPILWPLWRWVAYESYEHYADHLADLEAWAEGG